MSSFFNEILYRPLINALVVLYNTFSFNDLGIAIILLTILIRLVLYPLFKKSLRQQTLMQRIQPHVKKIQTDHKHDREKQAQALLELYRTHRINPFTGFLLLLVQIPVLIALYRVFLKGFSSITQESLYSFVTLPSEVPHTFLGLIDLQKPAIIIVGLAVIAQFLQSKMSLKSAQKGQDQNTPMARMGRQMMFIGPLLTLLFLTQLPSAVGLYWLTTSLFSVGQQFLITRSLDREQQDHGTLSTQSEKNS